MIKRARLLIISGVNTFKQKGIIGLSNAVIKKILKKSLDTNRNMPKSPINTKARHNDIIAFSGLPYNRKSSKNKKINHIAWIMPPPGKGSGGHLNIFRFIKYAEKAGYKCSIYIYVDSAPIPMDLIRLSMGDSYPEVKALNTMQWLNTDNCISSDVDAIIATSWETAYASYAAKSNALRLYFVQDFEPYFYPVGGMYTLAENTYKMGFFGITAGNWLKLKLNKEYGMHTASFNFSCDQTIYKFKNEERRREIFFYARPYTERRGFEVGILALEIFHKKHPDYIINLAGCDVSMYDIPFPYNNLNILEIDQLSILYNKCAAGLVLSYTNMSLLPLELLGCGTIPVVNDAPNNRLVSNNRYIAFTDNNPKSMAEKLSEIVERDDAVDYAQKASQTVLSSSWDEEGKKFINILKNGLQ
jgi:glycosyltransferase involved in cell wall biosynthesis